MPRPLISAVGRAARSRRRLRRGIATLARRLLALLLAFAPGFAAVGADDASRPNVVIFLTDDQGWADLGCFGARDLRTPNVDRLAAGGVRFTSWYSAAPVCSPSRAALLTGMSPQRAGVPANVSSRPGRPGMPAERLTLAERLKARGYATGAFGKWHLGSARGGDPNGQGFDRFFGFHAGCVDNFSHTFYWENPPHFHDLWRDDREVHEDGTYLTDLVTRESLRFLDERRDGPFFLYVAYNLPHYPMQAPQRLVREFAHLEEPRRTYAAMVAAVDESVGQVLGRLDRHGLAERTLVFFLSDHGATAEARGNGPVGDNGPFRGHKFSLFDGGLRVPCIARWPGKVPAGQVRDQLACTFDIAPTVAALAGLGPDPAHPLEGQDLGPVLTGDAPSPHKALCWRSGGQEAVRSGRWKLVRDGLTDEGKHLTGRDATFLSDLTRDPGESANLAAEHPEVVAELSRAFEAWSALASPTPPSGRPPDRGGR
jgi:arylsulfatase A